jgi:hypothetical protein
MYVCMYVSVYVCMCVCIYIHVCYIYNVKYTEVRNQKIRHSFHTYHYMARCLEDTFRLGVCIERKYSKTNTNK